MCPACIAAAALIASGAISTGGVAAFVAKKFRARRSANKTTARIEWKEKNP
jgi:uncharacterized protein YoaH (UPF0181 family)